MERKEGIISDIKYLKKLVYLLNGAEENGDMSMIASLITHHLEVWFDFKPGFSDWNEIVIEYLRGSYLSDPAGHIQYRYKLTESEAKQVYDELRRFHSFTY